MKLIDTFVTMNDKMVVSEFIQSLGGMARIGVRYDSLKPSTQAAFLGQVAVNTIKMDGRGAANNLHSLSKLGVKWNSLSPGIQTTMLDKLEMISNQQQAANTV